MKSSHSGTSIFSPVVLAVVLVVAAGEAATEAAGLLAAGAELFVETSVLAHDANESPTITHSGRRILFFI